MVLRRELDRLGERGHRGGMVAAGELLVAKRLELLDLSEPQRKRWRRRPQVSAGAGPVGGGAPSMLPYLVRHGEGLSHDPALAWNGRGGGVAWGPWSAEASMMPAPPTKWGEAYPVEGGVLFKRPTKANQPLSLSSSVFSSVVLLQRRPPAASSAFGVVRFLRSSSAPQNFLEAFCQ